MGASLITILKQTIAYIRGSITTEEKSKEWSILNMAPKQLINLQDNKEETLCQYQIGARDMYFSLMMLSEVLQWMRLWY